MDVDGLSSPPSSARLSLPPSSTLPPTNTASSVTKTPRRANGRAPANGNAHVNGNPVQADALALDDIQQDANMDGEEEAAGARRRRARMRGRVDNDVPLVRDALGEQITETFFNFLDTYVIS